MKKIIHGLLIGVFIFLASCSRVEEKKDVVQKADLMVINVLDEPFYEDVHIKGSVNVPFMQLTEFAKTLDKQTAIVVYCSNYACSASGAAAKQLRDMGFAQAWAYEGGMAEWYQLGFPVEGPATKDYIRAENKKIETDQVGLEISAHDLKERMKKQNLL